MMSIAFIQGFGIPTFDISILSEVGVKESWTKLFSIGSLSCIQRPIGARKNDDIFFTKEDGETVWINLCTQMIGDLGVGVKEQNFSHTLIYKESFVPIGGTNY